MSAQGGTLQRRGTIELPIWPVAVLVVAAIAAAIGMTLLRDGGQTRFVTSVTDTERLANSTAAVREQGAVAPAIDLTNSGVAIQHRGYAIPGIDPSILESSSAAVREQGATLPSVWGVSHVTPSQTSYAGQNPALHRQVGLPKVGVAPETGSKPIMVNGQPCMQCR
jgi:hypothetical protein